MAPTRTIERFHIAVLVGALAILGTACSDLDPVKVQSKCEGSGELDGRCPQCQTPPFAAECPQCLQSAPDEEMCLPKGTPWMDPALSGTVLTLPDGGVIEAGAGQTPEGQDTSGQSPDSGGSGSKPNTPNGGGAGSRGNPSSGGGGASGGSNASAMGGRVPPNQHPTGCLSDGDCMTPGFPACRGDGSCTECTQDHHCANGMQCNTNNHCVGCVSDEPCMPQGKVCLMTEAMCVQCREDGNCPTETPACTLAHECVRCTEPRHCPAETPTCSANTCVECDRDSDCTRGDKRVCISEEHRCVQCKAESDCRAVPERSHCFAEENTCVGCLKDADCSDPSASQCDPDSHSCVPCTSTTHCAQFKGSTSQCAKGQCVVCDRDGGSCGNKACILSTNTCSTKNRNSVAACEECASTDECIPGHVCVATNFDSRDTGNRCLPNYADFRGAGKPCPRPFSNTIRKISTVEAIPIDTLCTLPTTTSCAALADTVSKKQCNGNNRNCGLGQSDGFCGPDDVCTYNCTSADFCPSPMICSEDKRICL